MKKAAVVLVLAALAAATTNPALASCGGSHGKAYRTAHSSPKPALAKGTVAKDASPVEAIAPPAQAELALDAGVGPVSTEL